mmetsp:Transcript_104909/g.182366  ORF Transcript_104909/g.182366 Transcript_104909/m.182366 type:complete len:213 (-) Transcript_104909:1192-1830(-)
MPGLSLFEVRLSTGRVTLHCCGSGRLCFIQLRLSPLPFFPFLAESLALIAADDLDTLYLCLLNAGLCAVLLHLTLQERKLLILISSLLMQVPHLLIELCALSCEILLQLLQHLHSLLCCCKLHSERRDVTLGCALCLHGVIDLKLYGFCSFLMSLIGVRCHLLSAHSGLGLQSLLQTLQLVDCFCLNLVELLLQVPGHLPLELFHFSLVLGL